MLVLTRKQQESIQIGEDVTITILRTKGKTVRLGIEAPRGVSVLRGELVAGRDNDDTQAGAGKEPQALSIELEETEGDHDAAETAESEVQFSRVSRSRVATILPEVLGESGPLRSMLDRRSAMAS
ncbi:hypothetical protein Mal64_31140 [Pseudobythopirellula maris]|uniref:Translational regulator CsrA n=1 Tax=Pseudobythopirellula maris TaxID=2527991 RepID=A0A5C5ZJL1_9BACT|nr:carbon storage regulator [Pseudobythopirellula maris]TWT87572.1 hypothetical protein Mal64_31140 [Pseudobythopirellula maris]